MFTKIINEETRECLIMNQIEARNQGLQDMEVEFAYNGKMYLKGYAPKKSIEERAAESKQQKKQELRDKRDEYLKSKGYYFSENDKFNIINIINGYTEDDKNNYLKFLNNDLIPKYNNYSKLIDDCKNIEDVEAIVIKF